MNVLTRMDDADAGANTLDMPFRFYPCLAAGLSYYIALKKAPDRVSMLKGFYEEELSFLENILGWDLSSWSK